MATTESIRGTEYKGREAVEQIATDTFRVESFSEEGKFYQVNLETLNCSCPAHYYAQITPCKHAILSDAVAAIAPGIGASVVAERLTDYLKDVYAAKNAAEAYAAFTVVANYLHSTQSMVTVARLRLHRASELERGLEVA